MNPTIRYICVRRARAISFAHAWREELLDNTATENCKILNGLCFPRRGPQSRNKKDFATLNAVFHLAQLGIKHVTRLRPARKNFEANGGHAADSAVGEDAKDIKNNIIRAAQHLLSGGRDIEGLFAVKMAVQYQFEVESFSDLEQGDFMDFVEQHCPHLFGSTASSPGRSQGPEELSTTTESTERIPPAFSEDRLTNLISKLAPPPPTQGQPPIYSHAGNSVKATVSHAMATAASLLKRPARKSDWV